MIVDTLGSDQMMCSVQPPNVFVKHTEAWVAETLKECSSDRLQVYRELSVFFGAPVACGCKALCILSSATYIILNDKNSRKGR